MDKGGMLHESTGILGSRSGKRGPYLPYISTPSTYCARATGSLSPFEGSHAPCTPRTGLISPLGIYLTIWLRLCPLVRSPCPPHRTDLCRPWQKERNTAGLLAASRGHGACFSFRMGENVTLGGRDLKQKLGVLQAVCAKM